MKRLKETLDPIELDAHRRENCKDYDHCLDIAAHGRWTSFSCKDCERYAFGGLEVIEIKTQQLTYPASTYGCDYANLGRALTKSMYKQGMTGLTLTGGVLSKKEYDALQNK